MFSHVFPSFVLVPFEKLGDACVHRPIYGSVQVARRHPECVGLAKQVHTVLTQHSVGDVVR